MPSTALIEWTDVSVSLLFLEDSKTTPGSAKLSEKQWLDVWKIAWCNDGHFVTFIGIFRACPPKLG